MSAVRSSRATARHTPSAVVAMIGAGQLARMTQHAASTLDVELRVLSSRSDDPAVSAGAQHVTGSAADLDDLRAFVRDADVVTFDHEQVAPALLQLLEADGVALAPSAAVKLLAQDKLHARRHLSALGFPVPAFAHARTADDVEHFADQHGWPLIAKTPRGGYDGRGVRQLASHGHATRALSDEPGGLLIEPRLAIAQELAVLVARTARGDQAVYPVVETVQRDAMCREILAPAPTSPGLAQVAHTLATDLADAIDATGILAVELFVTADGMLVNELALRPHNSGHYTIEGCVTSQFEQHLRAVLEWPLGETALRAPAVATVNVVGRQVHTDPAPRLAAALEIPGAHVHLYGKAPRPGRKLGHVTVCGPDLEGALRDARRAAAVLERGEA